MGLQRLLFAVVVSVALNTSVRAGRDLLPSYYLPSIWIIYQLTKPAPQFTGLINSERPVSLESTSYNILDKTSCSPAYQVTTCDETPCLLVSEDRDCHRAAFSKNAGTPYIQFDRTGPRYRLISGDDGVELDENSGDEGLTLLADPVFDWYLIAHSQGTKVRTYSLITLEEITIIIPAPSEDEGICQLKPERLPLWLFRTVKGESWVVYKSGALLMIKPLKEYLTEAIIYNSIEIFLERLLRAIRATGGLQPYRPNPDWNADRHITQTTRTKNDKKKRLKKNLKAYSHSTRKKSNAIIKYHSDIKKPRKSTQIKGAETRPKQTVTRPLVVEEAKKLGVPETIMRSADLPGELDSFPPDVQSSIWGRTARALTESTETEESLWEEYILHIDPAFKGSTIKSKQKASTLKSALQLDYPETYELMEQCHKNEPYDGKVQRDLDSGEVTEALKNKLLTLLIDQILLDQVYSQINWRNMFSVSSTEISITLGAMLSQPQPSTSSVQPPVLPDSTTVNGDGLPSADTVSSDTVNLIDPEHTTTNDISTALIFEKKDSNDIGNTPHVSDSEGDYNSHSPSPSPSPSPFDNSLKGPKTPDYPFLKDEDEINNSVPTHISDRPFTQNSALASDDESDESDNESSISTEFPLISPRPHIVIVDPPPDTSGLLHTEPDNTPENHEHHSIVRSESPLNNPDNEDDPVNNASPDTDELSLPADKPDHETIYTNSEAQNDPEKAGSTLPSGITEDDHSTTSTPLSRSRTPSISKNEYDASSESSSGSDDEESRTPPISKDEYENSAESSSGSDDEELNNSDMEVGDGKTSTAVYTPTAAESTSTSTSTSTSLTTYNPLIPPAFNTQEFSQVMAQHFMWFLSRQRNNKPRGVLFSDNYRESFLVMQSAFGLGAIAGKRLRDEREEEAEEDYEDEDEESDKEQPPTNKKSRHK